MKDPKNKIAIRATEELKVIKEKRAELEKRDQSEQKRLKRKFDKMVEESKDDVHKRALILERDNIIRQQKFKDMLAGKQGQSTPQFEFINEPHEETNPSPEKQSLIMNSLKLRFGANIRGITLVEFDTEEDRDRDGVRLALAKYRPLFEHLFEKYTARAPSKQKPERVERQIQQSEIIRLLRDHNITHSLLSKTDMCNFMKLINRKMLSRYEEESLDYEGFVHFFIQLAVFFHLKEKFISPHETGGKSIH